MAALLKKDISSEEMIRRSCISWSRVNRGRAGALEHLGEGPCGRAVALICQSALRYARVHQGDAYERRAVTFTGYVDL